MRFRRIVLLIPLLAALALPTAADTSAAATIVLPARLVASRAATLAALTADGRLASGVVVEFSGGRRVTTDSTGRAFFVAPAEPGVLLAQVPGTAVSASATVLPLPSGPESGVELTSVPTLVSISDRFSISGGGFRGEADANQVQVGGASALVLAASPEALVILAGPHSAPGPTQIAVKVGGGEAVAPMTLVAVEQSSNNSALAQKRKGDLTLRVRGSELRLQIEVRNLTPEVVKLTRGNLQRVTTSGGADNLATLEMKGIRAGDYSIAVRLVPPASGAPDVERALQDLVAAQRLAPPDWARRVEKLTGELTRRPQAFARVRDQLEKMLAEKPEGEFGRMLQSAWLVLLNR